MELHVIMVIFSLGLASYVCLFVCLFVFSRIKMASSTSTQGGVAEQKSDNVSNKKHNMCNQMVDFALQQSKYSVFCQFKDDVIKYV